MEMDDLFNQETFVPNVAAADSENSRANMTRHAPPPRPYADTPMVSMNFRDLPLTVQTALSAVRTGVQPTDALHYLHPSDYELFSAVLSTTFRSWGTFNTPPTAPFIAISRIDQNIGPSFGTVDNATFPTPSPPPPVSPSRAQSSGMANDFNLHEASPSPGTVTGNLSPNNPRPPESSRVKCPDCDKTFKGEYGRGNMKRHQKFSCNGSVSKRLCEDCGREYARSDALSAHRKRAHSEHSPTQQ